MSLLRVPVRPLRRNMVRRQLHAYPPLTGGVDDRVPAVVLENMPIQHAGPERALRLQVGRVEHDNLTNDVHPVHATHPASGAACVLAIGVGGRRLRTWRACSSWRAQAWRTLWKLVRSRSSIISLGRSG